MRHMVKMGLAATCMALVACGGGKKGDTTPPSDDVMTDSTAPENTSDEAMVPPESIDEIQRLLARKRDSVSRCLSIVVDAKELPKNSHGKISLDITVGTNGKARSVVIVKNTLESKSLEECVAAKIREIPFPTIPSDFETTYVYGFESD